MTTLTSPNGGLNGSPSGITWEPQLLDRFWDSVFLPLGKSANIRDSLCSLDDFELEDALVQTPEIFFKRDSNPVINTKSVRSRSSGNGVDEQLSSNVWRPFEGKVRATAAESAGPGVNDLCRLSYHAPRITVEPSTRSCPSKQSRNTFRKPRLTIPNLNQRPENSVVSPGSALLALASNFLSTLVKLGKSQPSTPAPRLQGDDLHMYNSEVSIRVVDESFRGRRIRASEYRDGDAVEWCEGGPVTALYVPMAAIKEVGSAKEIDAFAKMSWEQQLMNVQ